MSLIRKIVADGSAEKEFFSNLKSRISKTDSDVTKIVESILEDVEKNGDDAVKNYTKKFDCANPDFYEVPRDEIGRASCRERV